jgi:small nuclear ribonucleoprotein (snRNP)-like protein
MNKENTVTNDESLKKLVNEFVVVKLNNGRVLLGYLREAEGLYTIKLGVKHLSVGTENIKTISIA